jgi:hypothetical protein
MPRKAKPKKTAGRSKPRSLPAWLTDRARLLSVASTTATVVIGAAIIVGAVIGRRPMLKRVAQERSSHVVRVAFDWPALPADPKRTWMDPDSCRDLEAVALARLKEHPQSISALANAQEALVGTGWFAGDCTLTREPEGVVRVSGRWRVPAAVIRADGRDRLIAATGERLPVAYPLDTSGRKVILGLEREALPGLGERWVKAGAVRAALDLLRYIADVPGSEQIHGVDVSAYQSSRRELVLVTDRGTRILWGGPVGTYNPAQARDQEKRSRLASVYTRYGRVDAGSAFIDVSLESGVEIQQPPAESTGM